MVTFSDIERAFSLIQKSVQKKKPSVPPPKGPVQWENLKDYPSSQSLNFLDSFIVTKATGKRTQIQQFWDIGSYVRALISNYTDKTEQLIVDQASRTLRLESPNPFRVIVFYVIQENGEGIATVQGTSESVISDVWTAVGTESQILRTKVAKPAIFKDGAWRATLNINMTKEANFIVYDYMKKMLHESSPAYLELKAGIIIQGRSTEETAVSGIQESNWIYHTKARTIVDIRI